MADPRKVPFVTLASYNSSTPVPESKKRRREDEGEGALQPHGRDGGGPFSNGKSSGAEGAAESKSTVRLSLSLSEPSEKGSTEFSYTELIQQATQPVTP